MKRRTPADRVRARYGIGAAAALLIAAYAEELERVLPFGFWTLPLVVLLLGAVALWLACAALAALIRRRWCRLASSIAGPALAAALFLLLAGTGVNPAVLRLLAGWPAYMREVDALPGPPGQRMAAWSWGGVPAFFEGMVDWTLVYDEADGLARPREQWDEDWTRRMALVVTRGDTASGEAVRHGTYDRLLGHFYRMTTVD